MKGGRYEMKGGKRKLVSRTESVLERREREAREAEEAAKKKAASKETKDTKKEG